MEEAFSPLFDKDVWVPFAATLIGGVLSLAGAFWALLVADKFSKTQRKEERLKEDAAKAVVAFYKVKSIGDQLFSLKSTIDKSFKQAAEEGMADAEAFIKVRQLTGVNFDVQEIPAEHLIFLAHIGKPQLVSEVLMVEQKVRSAMLSAKEYIEQRKSFDDFTLNNLPPAGEINTNVSGAAASIQFSGLDASKAIVKASVLQNLLGQIMENLDGDLRFVKEICSKFNTECQNHFGSNYPSIKIQWREESN